MTRLLIFIFLSLSGWAVLAADGAAAKSPYTFTDPPADSPTVAAVETTGTNSPATNAAAATPRVIDDKHKLQAGDQLSFRILEDRDPPGTPEKILLVGDSGEVDFPYIGLFNVAGKTCKQVDEAITGLLEKDYYYKATVNMSLVMASKLVGRVYIWGQVKTQGPIEIPPNENFTVAKAILRSGGFGDFAKTTKVKVIRTVNGEKQTFELNMEEIMEKGHTEKDITLEPDDFILVSPRTFNF
jgi:polysaccharide export outer membrane protein